jgi:hypothetical protein
LLAVNTPQLRGVPASNLEASADSDLLDEDAGRRLGSERTPFQLGSDRTDKDDAVTEAVRPV